MALAEGLQMWPFDQLDRNACVAVDEQLVSGCGRVLAVWGGSASCVRGATAHMVAYARAHGIPGDVVWPAGAARVNGPTVRLRLSARGQRRWRSFRARLTCFCRSSARSWNRP